MQLKEIYTIKKAQLTSRSNFVSDGIKCVHYGDIYKNYAYKIIESSKIINSFEPNNKNNIIKEDAIIIPDVTETISDYGHPTYIKFDGTPYINGTHSIAIINKSSNLLYLFYYLQNSYNIKRLQQLLLGSTVYGISKKDFENFELKGFHSTKEQQHIVDIIGSIDDKIENNERIIEKLEELMLLDFEKIYNKAKNNNCTINLNKFVDLKTGKKDANASEENGQYPFFTCSEANLKINDYSFDQEAILIAGNGNMNVKYYRGKFDAYQRTYVINTKNYFTYIYLYYKKFIKEISVGAKGSVIKFLTKSMLLDIDLPILDDNNMISFENKQHERLDFILNIKNVNKTLNNLKQLYLKKFFN